MTALGLMFQREYPPEELIEFTKEIEKSGLDELWVVEDCFYVGGIAQAATALAHSEKLKVGLGIIPAVSRNPAFTALEIASLARIASARFLAGIGHGVTEWMQQIGAFPKSQLAAIEETTRAVKGILSGENFSIAGEWAQLRDVQLVHPPQVVPPVYLGVRSAKSLQISGRVADGSILAEGCSPAYIRWAREQIEIGRQAAGRTDPHHITLYIYWSMDEDETIAEKRVRERLANNMAGVHKDPYQEALGIADDVKALLKAGGVEALRDKMPIEWLHEMAVFGKLEACAKTLDNLGSAGADSITLVPLMDKAVAVEKYLPRLLGYLGR